MHQAVLQTHQPDYGLSGAFLSIPYVCIVKGTIHLSAGSLNSEIQIDRVTAQSGESPHRARGVCVRQLRLFFAVG